MYPERVRTWTLVTDAISEVGHRRASSLAARGKDLILLGDMQSLLAERAAELRVVHDVDVRTLAVDLTDHDAVGRVVAWLRERDLPLDGLVSVRGGSATSADPVRARQLEAGLDALEAALAPLLQAPGTVQQVQGSAHPTRPPPAERPSAPPRSRAETARGHGDPSAARISTPPP